MPALSAGQQWIRRRGRRCWFRRWMPEQRGTQDLTPYHYDDRFERCSRKSVRIYRGYGLLTTNCMGGETASS
jgi:hypothetical protein